MSLSSRRHGFLLLLLQLAALGAIALIAGDLHAQASPPAGFAGAWRLDARDSNTADTVKSLLRDAERDAPAPASSTAPSPDARPGQGGRRGGGMGRGMGGGMGGHGGRGGKGGHGSGDAAKEDKGQDFRGEHPLPPTLEQDSVLLVQQDAQSLQVRFASGQTMDVRFDGRSRQTLAGTAMVDARREADGLHMSIQYADGSKLDERWALAADGKRLTVLSEWRAPGMAQPVSFRRSYVGLP